VGQHDSGQARRSKRSKGPLDELLDGILLVDQGIEPVVHVEDLEPTEGKVVGLGAKGQNELFLPPGRVFRLGIERDF
jgi:hypothetical protein